MRELGDGVLCYAHVHQAGEGAEFDDVRKRDQLIPVEVQLSQGCQFLGEVVGDLLYLVAGHVQDGEVEQRPESV